MASAPSSSRGRRQSQSTLAAMDVPRSRFHPAAIAGALIKHGKYVAFGAAGIWWLDLPSAVAVLLDSQHVWHKRALFAHFGLQTVTILIFLYLMLFLPWFRGYLPNYPKWQQSRRLRVIVPALTVSILLGWASLVFALRSSDRPTPGGPIRLAIRDALKIHAPAGFGTFSAMAGATAVYTAVFGLLGFIPQPRPSVKKTQ